MSEYILTERLDGDYINKLRIVGFFVKELTAKAKREKIISARCSRPIFNEFDPKDPKSIEEYRRTQEFNLEVWKKVI